MTLESIINFNIGTKVIFNPENHGFKHLGAYDKVKNRTGRVSVIETLVKNNIYAPSGFEHRPTGRISVLWDGDEHPRIYNYKRLKIIE